MDLEKISLDDYCIKRISTYFPLAGWFLKSNWMRFGYFMPQMHEYAFPFCQGFFPNLNLQVIAHVHIDSKPFNKKHSCIRGN